MITRRTLIRNAAASSAALMLPQTVWANAAMTIGTMQIDTLSDGQLTLPPAMTFGDLPATELAPILQQYGIAPDQTLTPDCNVTLVRDGERTILFDVGAGPDFMSSAGKLAEAFDALGVSADEITHVVFTHAHPDHLWGLLDDFDDPVFEIDVGWFEVAMNDAAGVGEVYGVCDVDQDVEMKVEGLAGIIPQQLVVRIVEQRRPGDPVELLHGHERLALLISTEGVHRNDAWMLQ